MPSTGIVTSDATAGVVACPHPADRAGTVEPVAKVVDLCERDPVSEPDAQPTAKAINDPTTTTTRAPPWFDIPPSLAPADPSERPYDAGMPTDLLPDPAAPDSNLSDPQAVAEAFLAALAASDLDAAMAYLADDVVYTNVGLPTIRGRERVAERARHAAAPDASASRCTCTRSRPTARSC